MSDITNEQAYELGKEVFREGGTLEACPAEFTDCQTDWFEKGYFDQANEEKDSD